MNKKITLFIIGFISTVVSVSAQQRVEIDEVILKGTIYYYEDTPFTGTILEYKQNSRQPITWPVIDGVANGIKTWYFDTEMTKVKEQVPMVNGLEHGYYIGYYESGAMMFITTMKKGKEHGTRYCFYEDGTRWHEHPYRKGEQYGMNIVYYPETGKLLQKLGFRGFTAHGRYIGYSKEGYKTNTGRYKNGKKEGTFKTYDERGKVIEIQKYKNGKLIEIQEDR